MFCFRIVSLRTCKPLSPARHSSEPRHDRCRPGWPLEPILCGCSKACIRSMSCCLRLEALCVVWRMHVCAPMNICVGTPLCVLWRPKVNVRALSCIFAAGSLIQSGACHFTWNGLPESPHPPRICHLLPTFPSAGIIEASCHTRLFTCVQHIQTQVLMLYGTHVTH